MKWLLILFLATASLRASDFGHFTKGYFGYYVKIESEYRKTGVQYDLVEGRKKLFSLIEIEIKVSEYVGAIDFKDSAGKKRFSEPRLMKVFIKAGPRGYVFLDQFKDSSNTLFVLLQPNFYYGSSGYVLAGCSNSSTNCAEQLVAMRSHRDEIDKEVRDMLNKKRDAEVKSANETSQEGVRSKK